MIKVDGKDYDFDALSPEAKAQFHSLKFVDTEIGRLEAQTAVFKTARLAYARALNEALQAPTKEASQQFVGDTLKLS
jgi:hypothetical protein